MITITEANIAEVSGAIIGICRTTAIVLNLINKAKLAWDTRMIDSFDLAAMTQELERDEGVRRFLYNDTKGIPTIGMGRNLRDVGLSPDEINLMSANDIARTVAELDRNLTWWRTLDPVRQRVMINMGFNLGWTELAKFVPFLAAVKAHDWGRAGVEMEQTLWWKEVGERAVRLQHMIINGEIAP